jgi:hypothetical protein
VAGKYTNRRGIKPRQNTIVLPIKLGQNFLIIPKIRNRVAGKERTSTRNRKDQKMKNHPW